MIHRRVLILCLLLSPISVRDATANTREIAELPADHEVTYGRDISPILKKNCVACHNESTDEGGVNLESVDTMLNSDVADVLVPGKPDASRLFLLASHADDPVMPPDDNDVSATPMNPMELAVLRRWIKMGAKVDPVSSEPSSQEWQPLPPELQTVYGSAMTPDGRMSAVSFGNQVRLFGSKSADAIDALEIVAGGQIKPAHDDFVQDLYLDHTGRRVISAGFRNVKFWEMRPFEVVSIPAIDLEDVLAVAMNSAGSHVAAFSPRGELSVAEVGTDRWQWMKGFEIPDHLRGDDPQQSPPNVHVAVNQTGHAVAVSWNKDIRIVRIDGKDPERIDCANEVTSILWLDQGQIVIGDVKGRVTFWSREGSSWEKSEQAVFEKPVASLCAVTDNPSKLIAVDVSGRIATGEAKKDFVQIGKLPVPASVKSTGDGIWVATETGALGKFDFTDKKYVELSKTDPVAENQFASRHWETLVGEKLVAANEKESKLAEANVTAEQKSLDTLAKDIEAKTKLRGEKQKAVAEANAASELAAKKFADAKSAEQESNEKRKQLSETIQKLAGSIAELEKRHAELKLQKSDAEKNLAAVPDAKKLAESVKSAGDAAGKAEKNATKKTSDLAGAAAALKLAEESKSRGEARLKGLKVEVQRLHQVLEQEKAGQEERQAKELGAKSERDQSQATERAFAVIGGGDRLLTRSQTSGAWSLWSAAGDWLAELPDLSEDRELIAAAGGSLLMKGAGGVVRALKATPKVWRHRKTIGSAIGESPFADRVLCVDVDSAGNLLATGGGEPSRSGELMIWNRADGKLVRRIETPHSDTVLCVQFSPDGRTLASGGADRMIKLWDVQSGNLIKTLEGHTHHVTAIAWNVNRRQLASGSADATVKIWNVESGQSTRTISGLKSEVTRLVYLGRDDRVGITSGDSYFRVYRTDNGSRETNAKVGGGYLYALDANRDGTNFIVGGAEGTAVIVDKSGKSLRQYD